MMCEGLCKFVYWYWEYFVSENMDSKGFAM